MSPLVAITAFALVIFLTILIVLAVFEKMVTGFYPWQRKRLTPLERARAEALAEVKAAQAKMDTQAYRKACAKAKALTTQALRLEA